MAIKGPNRLSFVGAVSGPPGSGVDPVVPDVQIIVPDLTMAAEQTGVGNSIYMGGSSSGL